MMERSNADNPNNVSLQGIQSHLLDNSTEPRRLSRTHSDPRYHSSKQSLLPHIERVNRQYVVGFIPPIPEAGVALTNLAPDASSLNGQGQVETVMHSGKGSQLVATFMLCSVSLGVGVFVLPSVLLTIGVIPGLLLLGLFAAMNSFAMTATVSCAEEPSTRKATGYEHLASLSMGRFGEFFLAIFMMISLLMGNCAHIQTVGQLLHDLIEWFYTGESGEYKFNWDKTAILYAVMLSLTTPWLFQRNLHGLSSVGTLSVSVVMITAVSLVITCLYKFAANDYPAKEPGQGLTIGFSKVATAHFWTTGLWKAAPTVAFAFTGILELFPVYLEIHERNHSKIRSAIIVSNLICFSIYALVASIVSCTFGQNLNPNSLYNIPPTNYWITICCFFLVIVITLLYPVINYPMINALETLLDMYGCCSKKPLQIPEEELEVKERAPTISAVLIEPEMESIWFCWLPFSKWWDWAVYHRREIMSLIGVVVVISIDIAVPNLDDLFGLCGSLGLSFVCYIFPMLIFLKVKWNKLALYSPQLWIAVFILLFSTTIMIYSTVVIIMGIF